MATMSCPNEGCKKTFVKSQFDGHVQNCQYTRNFNSQQCKQDTLTNHTIATERNSTMQQCCFAFLSCLFVGNSSEITVHIENNISSHLEYICKLLSKLHGHLSYKPLNCTPTSESNEAMKQSLLTDVKKVKAKVEQVFNKTKLQATEIQEIQRDIAFHLNGIEDFLATIHVSITEAIHAYDEISLSLQLLQASDGKYIWKIPDIIRRTRDTQMGKIVRLYSVPFYTDRFGYKLRLCVYLDGDGSGKGRYISYFLTIMKGEYDALLDWPFQLTVTLSMINQKGNGNIVQSFKPNPNSASFHQPKSDMNVASGCPKFAALSVLDNPEFIVDDVAFFQCVVNSK